MNSIIKDFVVQSQILDPNENKQSLVEWANRAFRRRIEKGSGKDKVRGRDMGVKTRSNNVRTGGERIVEEPVDKRKVIDFKELRYTIPEKYITKWDLSTSDLKPFYDTARLAREYKWTDPCTSAKWDRRLPWLYPDEGILTSLQDFSNLTLCFLLQSRCYFRMIM